MKLPHLIAATKQTRFPLGGYQKTQTQEKESSQYNGQFRYGPALGSKWVPLNSPYYGLEHFLRTATGVNIMRNETDIRNAFWNVFCVEGKPREFWGRSHNQLPCDVRCAFVDFVDAMQRDGEISESLAKRVTL